MDDWLKIDVFWRERDEIVAGPGIRADQRIHVRQIRAWQVFAEMGFDVVSIELTNDTQLNWCDKYGDLTAILRHDVPDKERTMV
jgi:hypothetical protein